MATTEDAIRNELVLKEEALLSNETRSSADALSKIVNDDCIEINEAGTRGHYRAGAVFGAIEGALYIIENTVHMVSIAQDCRLLVYTAARVKKNTRTKAACSSIWKAVDGEWKVVFHQRTTEAEQPKAIQPSLA